MQPNLTEIQTIGIGLAAFLSTLIAIFIFLSARTERLGKAMWIAIASVAVWAWFGFLYEIVPNITVAREMRVVSEMGIVCISFTLVNFALVYLEERTSIIDQWSRRVRLISTAFGALLILILMGDLFGGRLIVGNLASPTRSVLAPQAGPLMTALVAFYVLNVAVTAALFVRSARASKDADDRHQVEVLASTLTVALIFGGTRFVPWYGYDSTLLISLSGLAVPLFFFGAFYAIKRYKLLNIQVIGAQILIFVLWSFTFFRILFDKTAVSALPDIGLFLAVLVLGVFLLRSIVTETRSQKELALLTIDRVKSEFVTVAAHQLRTPLTAVRWAFNLLSPKDIAGSLTDEQRRMVELGRGAADNMTLIVNDLLNVANISGGSFRFSMEPGDVREAVRSAANLFDEAARRKNLRFSIDLPSKTLPARFDRGNLALALENLIDNAVKYTPEGGSISVRASREAGKIFVRIADTGIGISHEERARLFEKFFRGKSAVRMFTDGSGLGLFIAKNIIKGHGGTLTLLPREGGGTEAVVEVAARV